MTTRTLSDPDTPFAVVDRTKLTRNIGRLRGRIGDLGTHLRPHIKTAKSIDVASLVFDGGVGPITVSTLAEAEAFADAGYTDIVYAVGIAPSKLPRVHALLRRGVRLTVLLDSIVQAVAVAASFREDQRIPVLIEVDCDGHRGGVRADGSVLIDIANVLMNGADLRGVLVHAGESYGARTKRALVQAAENERETAVSAASALRSAGHPVNIVSVGSTPTAHVVTDLAGVTEVRAGNYVFFDLMMAGLGVCAVDDIALSVVVTVIGQHAGVESGIITDGGWTAMSQDHENAATGYGVVTTLDGIPLTNLVVTEANQEHSMLRMRPGTALRLPDLTIGTRLRVLPHHACATADQFTRYHVIDGTREAQSFSPPAIVAEWTRVIGW